MNYRHIYHAGNICDVVKHAIFALLIDYLALKDKPYAILDTHAGCGFYDLEDPRAQKTKEYETGATKLWEALRGMGHLRADHAASTCPASLRPFADVLVALNADGVLRVYPGSPLLARKKLRAKDRLILCELHPDDAGELKSHFFGDPQIQLHHRDGYEAVRALMPFAEKRGILLIDPPYEKGDDFEQVIQAVKTALMRVPGLVVGIWYPIKDRALIWKFHEALAAANFPKMFVSEFIYRPEARADTLNGTGLITVNTPHTLPAQLEELLPALHDILQTEEKGVVLKALAGV